MQVDVLIVGAGASGLTAGQFLHNYGLSVLILEGASRPYGRVRRVEGFTKFPLEAGGEELYNKKGLYYRICQQAGAKIFQRKDAQTYVEHPTEQRLMRVDEFEKRYPREAKVIDVLTEYVQKVPEAGQRSVKDVWNELNLDAQFKFWGQECLGTENGGDWSSVALDQVTEVEEIFPTFDDVFLLANMNHEDVFQKAFPDAIRSVRCNQEVTQIEYANTDGVVLTRTAKGETYRSKHVLVTSSLRVLQNNVIAFSPALPKEKKKAIDSLGIDPAGKLFLKFSRHIFESDVVLIYIDFYSIFGWLTSDERSKDEIVWAFLACDTACKKIDDNAQLFIDHLLQHLQKLSKIADVKKSFLGFHWKNWGSERLVLAGHSYDTPNTVDDARAIYAEPVDNKLFFAGEAANADGRHGGINGAVDSGAKAATDIAIAYYGSNVANKAPKL